MLRLLLAVPIILTMLSILGGAHWYVADRLILALELPDVVSVAALTGLGVLAASVFLQPIGERLLPRRIARLIAWPAALWLGFAFYLILLLIASDLVLGLLKIVGGSLAEPSLELARLRAAFVLLVAALFSAVAIRGGLAPPRLRSVAVGLRRWPDGLAPLRIVQICDIHIGSILDRVFAGWLVERVNALEPDLIAITGDLVDGPVARLADEVAPFARLRAPLGVFLVTGNHDHYSGGRAWAEHAKELGMQVLRNERVELKLDAGTIELAGVDDHRSGMLPAEQGEDLDAALAGRNPEALLLLLAHDPSTFKRASGMGVDLQLSGHTHGGQIWPFQYLVRLAVPFVAGLYRRGEAQLYVSRGTGFWGPPMRLHAPAEITEITLGPPAAGDSPAQRV